jgi:predicted RNA binding protein with dsRBD fold (UPF0201 family)
MDKLKQEAQKTLQELKRLLAPQQPMSTARSKMEQDMLNLLGGKKNA